MRLGAGDSGVETLRDGLNAVRCGAGRESVRADRSDRLVACERVKRR
jgi:hypothetical protein